MRRRGRIRGAVTDGTMRSMFHQRLVLLGVGFVVALVPISAQLARLTIAQHDRLVGETRRRLVRLEWTPTVRGRILDRTGRVLAMDRASSAVTVRYDVLDGSWAISRASQAARERHRDRWRDLDDATRERLVSAYHAVIAAHVERSLDEVARACGLAPFELRQRREEIVRRVSGTHDQLARERVRRDMFEAMVSGAGLSEGVRERIERRAREPIREQRMPHILARDVPDAVAFAIRQRAREGVRLDMPGGALELDALPGVGIDEASDRVYPLETTSVDVDASSLPAPLREDASKRVEVAGVATHVLGWMRDTALDVDHARREEALREDAELARRSLSDDGRDRGAYFPDDPAGLLGAERAFENRLRGLRGLRSVRLDTGEVSESPAAAGQDVTLTIDAMLQARVQAILDPALGLARVQPWHDEQNPTMAAGTPIHGGAVVLEIRTGEILAMVSSPSFTRAEYREHAEAMLGDPVAAPLRNRVLESAYPPGSVAKALVLAEAIALGAFADGERIDCHGHLYPNQPDRLRCWVYKRFMLTHTQVLGDALNAVEGLMTSCNVFFFSLAQRLGPGRMEELYRSFGVGRAWGLGLGPESPGLLGASVPGASAGLEMGDAIQMGIGQGPVAWTLLHAADAMATIARAGERVAPRIARDAPTRGESARESMRAISISEPARRTILEGLRRVIADPRFGTANHVRYEGFGEEAIFNTPEHITLWGKTGTAQAPVLFEDANENGRMDEGEEVLRRGDHAWFVVLAGVGEPAYAVAVLMEYAGSGAKVSGPIANQIVHALIDEGYLPDASG